MSENWKSGDRVLVCLPPGRPGKLLSNSWFAGTVREVDPPGLRPGVRVDLDYPVNGVSDCYATHSELHRAAAQP
jgi:hypothetical protein